MSLVSPPPTSAPFPIPPVALTPLPQLSSPAPASQPNATTPSLSPPPSISPPQSAPPTNSTSSSPASPPLPESPDVTPPPPMASPPTESTPPATDPPPAFSPPPTPASSPPPQSSPPPNRSPPPPSSPPPDSSPPPSSPPVSSSPPPEPPPTSTPPQPAPPTSSPPPVDPPPVSPPPVDPPPVSPPPQPTTPPTSPSPSPPPKDDPPPSAPPPPARKPGPPPPKSPGTSPPPQSPEPPKGSSPSPPSSPASKPPQGSPPTPPSVPPKNTPPSPPSPANSPPSPPFVPPQGSPPTLPSRNPSPPVPSGGSTPNNNAADHSDGTNNGSLGTERAVAIGIVLAVVLLGIIGAVGWCIWRRKKKAVRVNGGMPASHGSTPSSDSALLRLRKSTGEIGKGSSSSSFQNSPAEPGGLGNSKIWFTYAELVEATNDFSARNLLGEGGFGSVYKGCLADGRDVAVKQLNIGGRQGDREFRAEVEIISRVHHRHLISLVGYCISENKRLLVYDYAPNNTLYYHLHAQGRPVMDWAIRVKVAVGAARGIAYLHEDCTPRIIHRDIKSSNILLDNNFEARVADFGLAKLAQDANTHVTTRVVGTFGYMAPEYASSGKLTEKSDIYSFGVVLLELITGRKPVDTSQPLGDESLVEWARPLLSHALEKGEVHQLADPRLEKNYVATEMFRLIEAAAACVRHSAAKRPAMGQIMRAFDNLTMSDLSNGMKVGESTIYNSAQQSAEIRLFRRMAFGSPDLDFSSEFFSQGTQHSVQSQSQHSGQSPEDRV